MRRGRNEDFKQKETVNMKSHLLNDEAILHFIARGYCVEKV